MNNPRQGYNLLSGLFWRQISVDIVPIALSSVVLPSAALWYFPQIRVPSIALMLPIIAMTLLVLPNSISRLRGEGTLDYLKAMPVGRGAVILALTTVYSIATLPSIAGIIAYQIVVLHTSSATLLLLSIPLLLLFSLLSFLSIMVSSPYTHTTASVIGVILAALLTWSAFLGQGSTNSSMIRLLWSALPTNAIVTIGLDVATLNHLLTTIGFTVLLAAYAGIAYWLADHTIPWRSESRGQQVADIAKRQGQP